jgi:hypothetical protein
MNDVELDAHVVLSIQVPAPPKPMNVIGHNRFETSSADVVEECGVDVKRLCAPRDVSEHRNRC